MSGVHPFLPDFSGPRTRRALSFGLRVNESRREERGRLRNTGSSGGRGRGRETGRRFGGVGGNGCFDGVGLPEKKRLGSYGSRH